MQGGRMVDRERTIREDMAGAGAAFAMLVLLAHAAAQDPTSETTKRVAARPALAPRVKVGRNKPCLCGSGKKWKRCCGGPRP